MFKVFVSIVFAYNWIETWNALKESPRPVPFCFTVLESKQIVIWIFSAEEKVML